MRRGLMIACLIMLSGCAAAAPCPPKTKLSIPVVYLQEVTEPKLIGIKNADLVTYSLDLQTALRKANADKKAIKEYMVGQ